jgi:hypothetical protein
MRVADRAGDRRSRQPNRANVYNGRIGVEYRGKISRSWPKLSLALETRTAAGQDREVRLLGLPREADWILHASYADRSLLRNVLAFEAARRLGAWAPGTRFVELMLDGAYHGVYVLMEPLEFDRRRIRAPKKSMLLEVTHHPPEAGEVSFTAPVSRMRILIADAGEKVSAKEHRRATTAIDGLERALYGPAFADPATGWRRWLDERSAVDYVLVQELFRNQDAFWSSMHMHVAPDGPLRLGPVWDFDLSSGNPLEPSQLSPEGWRLAERPWGARLLTDPGFMRALAARWRAARSGGLVEALMRSAQDQSRQLAGPALRNFRRWPVLGQPVLPVHPVRASYAEEVAALQDWLGRRAAWLDQTLAAG